MSDAKYVYILVRYSPTGVEIFGATGILAKAHGFETRHPDNRAIPARLEIIGATPLKPLNDWPR